MKLQSVILTTRYKDYKSGRMLSLEDNEAQSIVSQWIAEYVENPEPIYEINDTELPTIEAFVAMKAEDQKQFLKKLQIEGDDGNEEKRAALYASFIEGNGGGGDE